MKLTVSILQVTFYLCINNLLFDPIIVNFIRHKHFVFIRTNRTALYSNVHMHTRSVIQGQRAVFFTRLRFRMKDFICSQCDLNYNFYVLIKIKQQINSCKTHFTDYYYYYYY